MSKMKNAHGTIERDRTMGALLYSNSSRFLPKLSRQWLMNQSSSGRAISRSALRVCWAAEANSRFPAFSSSMHLMWAESLP